MEKLIIYDEMGLKVTPASNYNLRIRNERKVTDCSEFTTAIDIIAYYCKYFGNTPEDFIDMTNA